MQRDPAATSVEELRIPAGTYRRRHLRFGWWSLLVFLSLGVVLELMHGFKVTWYLSPSSETRRLMWTLGHAHGTLLALVHLIFSAAWAPGDTSSPLRLRMASSCLIAASVLMPAGFILGGLFAYAGDPGLGILLLPLGAGALGCAVLILARMADAIG